MSAEFAEQASTSRRPRPRRDANGDEAKGLWTVLITTDDEVAALQFESLHFATLNLAEKSVVGRRGLRRAPVRTSSESTREQKC